MRRKLWWLFRRQPSLDDLRQRYGPLPAVSGGEEDPEDPEEDPDPPKDPPKSKEKSDDKVVFTREQQIKLDELIDQAFQRGAQQAEEKARKKAELDAAKEQGEWSKLIEDRDEQIQTLTSKLEKLEADHQTLHTDFGRMKAVVNTLSEGLLEQLPPLTRKAIEKLDAVSQLEFVAENIEELGKNPAARVKPTGSGNREHAKPEESHGKAYIRSRRRQAKAAAGKAE